MELIIKETGYTKEEACKKEPVFKMEDGVLVDCNLNGSKIVTIPADVKIIDKMCFISTDVKEVILPEGVESIEERAFSCCNKLRKINFPETLNAIKERAFYGCVSLAEVILPERLAEIGDYAFHCAGIKQLVLPKRAASTGINVFSSIKIESINIPENFSLDIAMFAGCANLHTVNFEADQITIPERCFCGCTNLTEIDINKALFIEDSAFLKCHSLSVNTIPAHTYVGVCAFSETDVTDVIIEDISKISERAFAECKPLKKLTINVPVSVAGLSVPGGLACECKSLKTVTFTGHIENLSSIKEAAFRGTMMLTEINLPDNIRLIEKEAFHGSGIESIHLPENLKQIGIRAFMSSDLKSITVPDKTVKLGKSTFEDCVHLTEATLPKSITTIPERVFINCVSLKTVNASNINVVCCGAFSNCVSLEAFDFSQVKELGSRSFSDSGLHEVVFSNKPPKLQLSVFCNCKNLQQVDMSACNKIETISAHCFANCSSLKDIKLPPNVHKFDDGCFTSVKLDKLVIKAGMRVNFHAFSETSINELEFIDDAGKSAKTVVDLYAFENAKVGRLIMPDHMYDRFKEVIAKMR